METTNMIGRIFAVLIVFSVALFASLSGISDEHLFRTPVKFTYIFICYYKNKLVLELKSITCSCNLHRSGF